MDMLENSKDYLLYQEYLKKEGILDFDRDKEYWGNVPITTKHLKCLYKYFKPNMKFLDLGCGAGNVLRFAKNIGFDVTGVEFDKKLIPYLNDYKYLNQNIKELDKEFYSDFDIIYSYKPLKDDFKDYVDLVIDSMKSGSFIVTPSFRIKNDKVKRIGQNIYKK